MQRRDRIMTARILVVIVALVVLLGLAVAGLGRGNDRIAPGRDSGRDAACCTDAEV